MIPESFIESWRTQVKWQSLNMVEQDLVISRALICLYNDQKIKNNLIFRGGTALNKLFIKPPARYSEDLDFTQRMIGPIGEIIDKIRVVLEWLGQPKRKATAQSTKLIYQYQSINDQPAKLKIEINTVEHFHVLPLKYVPYSINSEWFNGNCEIITCALEELMATKLRALYQRRKGRDLFDLWFVIVNNFINIDQVIEIFYKYCAHENIRISKKLFQENLELKKLNRDFRSDMNILLPYKTNWNFEDAFNLVQTQVISKL